MLPERLWARLPLCSDPSALRNTQADASCSPSRASPARSRIRDTLAARSSYLTRKLAQFDSLDEPVAIGHIAALGSQAAM